MKQENNFPSSSSTYPGNADIGDNTSDVYGAYQYQNQEPYQTDQFQYNTQYYQPSSYDDTIIPTFQEPPSSSSSSTSASSPSPTPTAPSYTTAFSSPILTETLNYPKVFHPTSTPHILDPLNPQSKHPLPSLPLPSTSHLHHRFSPLLDQVVNLFMRDGKKATAQKYVQRVLDILRTKSPPKEQSRFSLIPNHPPLAQLPRNPLAYLQTAIDSVAPLLRLKTMKGSGGFSNQVPEPLSERQRRRTAIKWMMNAANNKKDRMRFAERFAEEVVAVVEGRSSAWDRKLQVHKTAVGARANVKVKI